MNSNPIKYSELIQPDSSITDLIKQLQDLIAEYDAAKSKIQGSAQQMAQGLQAVSGATEEQRKAIQQTTEQSEKLVASYKQIDTAETAVRQKQYELTEAFKESTKIEKLMVDINTSAEGSYNRLSAQYRLNKIYLNQMSGEERRATEAGKQLEAETAQIYAQMNELQKATGKYTLQVGNYEIAGKSLRTQMMELVQTMAQLRMEGKGNTKEFNDYAEQLGRLRDIQKDIQRETSALGSDTKNLDSIMGAASAARGGMSVFTGTLALMGANSEGASKAQKVLGTVIGIVTGLTAVANALQKESALMIGLRTIKTKLFTKSLQTETAATVEHTAAVEADAVATQTATAATSGFKKALIATGIGAVIVLIGELIAHFSDLAKAIGLTSEEADAAFEDIGKRFSELDAQLEKSKKFIDAMGGESFTKLIEKFNEVQNTAREAYRLYSDAWDKYNDLYLVQQWGADMSNKKLDEMYEHSQALRKEAQGMLVDLEAGLIGMINASNKAMRQLGMTDYEKSIDDIIIKAEQADAALNALYQTHTISKERFDLYKEQVLATLGWEIDQVIAAEKAKSDAEAKAAAERAAAEWKRGRDAAKRTAEAAAEALMTDEERLTKHYREQLAQLQKYGIDATALTEKYEADLQKVREAAAKKQEDDAKKVAAQEAAAVKARLASEQKAIELRLSVVEKGSDQERELQLAAWENRRQQELHDNAQLSEELRQDEAAINAKWDAYIISESAKAASQRAKELLEIQQEYEESAFNLLDKNERQKTLFQLQQEKARLLKILEIDKQMSKEQRDTILNTIAAIEKEAARLPYNNIYELLGIGIDKDQQDALNAAIDSVKDSVDSLMDSWSAAADKALEAADKQVEATKKVLDAEIEARNEGYANRVTMAQKEYDLAIKQQQKAQKEKEKAQKAQLAADSIEQSSSLVTASANLWKAFSGAGVLGPALAVAAIATMWGSFIAAKVKAASLATETYGEGTVELLEGGSHASGHDIDLGMKRDGTRRRAEGGEFFAVINKRSSRRYRGVIPDVINSLNDGTFADKYMQASNRMAAVAVGSPDISGLARDVAAIREQGDERRYADAEGNTIIQYKNLTRKIYKS